MSFRRKSVPAPPTPFPRQGEAENSPGCNPGKSPHTKKPEGGEGFNPRITPAKMRKGFSPGKTLRAKSLRHLERTAVRGTGFVGFVRGSLPLP